MDLIACGRLGRPHGVRGALRVWPFNPQTELLQPERTLRIGGTPKSAQGLRIESVSRDAKSWIVTLAGIGDRDAAAKLTNLTWYETRDAFEPAADDEIYVADLVGLAVTTPDGQPLGTIADVWQTGPADILVIRDKGREHLVPNVPDFVQRLDPANPPAIVTPIDGLLDES